jgi:hypothetical protein
MNDAILRAAVRKRLERKYGRNPDTLVLEELGLRHGKTRVDLAVVNGRLEGFELKSDKDRLTRLASQAAIYGDVLDRVTLVAGTRHVSHALDVIPVWWGVVSATQSQGTRIQFDLIRPAQRNNGVDPLSLAKLLWREEALRVLETRGVADGVRSAKRSVLYSRLASVVPLPELQQIVRTSLKNRKAWRLDDS